MSFPQNNNGLPEGSTPMNGGGMDGQPPPAPAMQGPPAGQNAANESARTIRADGCPEGDGRLPAHGQYNWLVSVDMLLVELENIPGRVNTDEGMIVLPMTRSPGTDEQPASTASRPDNI
ncbi:hypothetical protein F5883DRAFT_513879 [Diaporthe sp. PMI_573]|nr:hypothetical protein F5883DRAFT_513879 [Diaporthaceae sp. PMI_573]